MRVLVLYQHLKGETLLAVRQQMHLLDGRGLRIAYRNATAPAPAWLAWMAPDLCILSTTFLGARWQWDFEETRRRFRWVSSLRCPKVALPQDEYDHSEVLNEWLHELGVTSVYSCFGRDTWATLYPQVGTHAAIHETLTGFIDEQAASAVAERIVPHAQRPYDIVYRARNLPYWFGSHGQLKHRIADAARDAAGRLGLKTDVSTRPEDTVYGDRWLDFLMSGRAVVGVESGSSVLDSRGEIRRRITRLLAEQPDLTFEQVDAQMPAGWDSYTFFAISPRHLEAVVTKTAQVLVEGAYSGVLEPERHYIPVRRDLSDLDVALARLSDVEAVDAMTERAYRDIYLSRRYDLSVLADQIHADAEVQRKGHVALSFALATSPVLPTRRLLEGTPLRQFVSWSLTFADALVWQPAARRLLAASLRGRVSLPLKDVVRELVLLRVLSRVSKEVERIDTTIVIRTGSGARARKQQLGLERGFAHVVWNHGDPAIAVYPRHRRWGWIGLGEHGRYAFPVLEEVARIDAPTAHALLVSALGV